jgi:hypothetical protein
VNTKILGGISILVLIAGIGSFALEHSAYAQTGSSDVKPKTKVDVQKENRAKALDKITNDEKANLKIQKFKELASKMMHAKFKINDKAKR